MGFVDEIAKKIRITTGGRMDDRSEEATDRLIASIIRKAIEVEKMKSQPSDIIELELHCNKQRYSPVAEELFGKIKHDLEYLQLQLTETRQALHDEQTIPPSHATGL